MGRTSRAQAARELGLDKATITRWCQKHPALLDENGLVSVEELREHRLTVVNPKLQTRVSSQAAPAVETAAIPATPDQAGPSLNDHRTRKERAQADDAELDLAERLGLTLRREDVERAIAEAGDVMRKTAAQMVRDRAERLSVIDDARAMERALEDMMRDLLAATSAALSEACSGGDRPEDRDAA